CAYHLRRGYGLDSW
nr:immunoglobulin heavy chain junction region [Macaca mulatta]